MANAQFRRFMFLDPTVGHPKSHNPANAAGAYDSLELFALSLLSGGEGLNANSAPVYNVPTPTLDHHAANKAYVDAVSTGFHVKAPVRVATTSAITSLVTGAPLVVDGVTLVAGNRVLVKNQAMPAQNGIYTVTTPGTGSNGVWARAADAGQGELVGGTYVFVNEGTAQKDTSWLVTTDDPITVDITGITWTQFASVADIIAGDGISKVGNTISVSTINDTQHGTRGGGSLHSVATTGSNGFMSSTDKSKLDGIASGATANTGTVTSVGLSLPSILTVSGSPVTTSGTLTAVLASQTQKYFFAAPNAANGAPTFRAILASDIPTLNQNTTGQAGSVANALTFNSGGAGDASGTTFNGSAAKTLSYNSIGAVPTSRTVSAGSGLSGGGDLTANRTLAVDPSDGITVDGNGVAVSLSTDAPGLQLVGTEGSKTLEVKLMAAGGLIKDSVNGIQVDVDLATLDKDVGGWLKVIGLPSQFKVNGTAVGTSVTAAALDALTTPLSVITGMHTHSYASALLTAAEAISSAKWVAIGASGNIVNATNTTEVGARVIGIAPFGIAQSASGYVMMSGILTGMGSSYVAGTTYYLGTAGDTVTYSSLASGARVIQIGHALSSGVLAISIMDFGTKP